METLKNQLAILIFASFLFLLQSCSNTKAENKQTTANDSPVTKVSMEKEAEAEPTETPKIAGDLIEAKEAGQAVFVVVTENGSSKTDEALAIANEAKSIYENASVLQMNRDDVANAELVKEWRLAGAPLPLILVVSPKGTLTGGRILAQATAENIASLVPSPKLEQVYEAIGNQKYAIVTFTKKSFADRPEVLKECNEAVSALGNEAVLVEVDMENQKEKGFMNQVRINPKTAKASVTLVINKQGQVAGTSTTIPDSDKLVAAATTPVKSGCGPGCGPAGCGQ